MRARLDVTPNTCCNRLPLGVVEGPPGVGAELTPAQQRSLAAALLRAADDAERRPLVHRGKLLPAERRTYPLLLERAA